MCQQVEIMRVHEEDDESGLGHLNEMLPLICISCDG